MKKLYQIPKSQLIVIMIFSVIGEFVIFISLVDCSDSYGNCGFLGFLSVLLPFLFIFYLVGWKHYNKSNLVTKIENVPSKFCTKCGEKNTLNSKYCVKCGELIIN
ncbi:hypothetical protein A3G98_01015 [Candidatus Nomurabacteria bacterium RIFCSPLOWO2_12_FULL_37_8]|uniref:Zinc-ribbon domain-containing protein n=1 Tax=Candidatus Nomurabacteria bacterium RIFCSPLOWO2_12_FULL_37_8 TaxID=1801793 RepID=A0A1F6Y6S3_9BACT|nr:MAG: hypothetical protein A3G98_01015 [Candidatus Nomurabacteria bacterium RIFCSPLOWO2_12_FULL_37_8]